MKKSILAMGALAAALGMASCSGRTDAVGSWAGEADLPIEGASSVYARVVYDLNADSTAQASYAIDFSMPLPQSTEIVTPYQASVSATATISGSWQWAADKGNELALAFDPATLSVTIDPEALEMRANVITSQQAPELDTLRPQIAAAYQAEVERAIASRASLVLDDVKTKEKGTQLTFEIGGKKYAYKSVAQPVD